MTSITLAQARQFVLDNRPEGVHCPACDQFAKEYLRNMTAFTAKAMIAMYWHHRNEYVHMPTLIRNYLPGLTQGGYATLSKYWGLIEEETKVRPDGGRAGYWTLTTEGVNFLMRAPVPKYAVIYDGRLLRYDGELVTIEDILKEPFDLDALMDR